MQDKDYEFIEIQWMTDQEETAKKLIRELIEMRLVACANQVAPVSSMYVWKGAIEEAQEVIYYLKTRAKYFHTISQKIQEIGGYEVPAILSLPIFHIHESYLKWLNEVI